MEGGMEIDRWRDGWRHRSRSIQKEQVRGW